MKKLLRVSNIAMLLFGMMLISSKEVHAATEEATYLGGIYVEDMSLEGMTIQEAQDMIATYIEELASTRITVNDYDEDQLTTTVKEMGIQWTNPEILEEAMGIGHTGNVIHRFKDRADLAREDKLFPIELTYDDASIELLLTDNEKRFTTNKVDASVRKEGDAFIVLEGKTGYALDVAATTIVFQEALDERVANGEVAIDAVLLEDLPRGTAEELSQIKHILGTYTTSYTTSAIGRCENIRVATEAINGTTLYPGEEFSTLDKMLPFDASKGYQLGGSYVGGMVVQSYGGGVCQVSSTLYNAVMNAELEITERLNHGMTVSYVPLSQDSVVSGSGLDLKFTNPYDYPIYIEGITSPDRTCTFTIYGLETRPANRVVTYVSEVTETIVPVGERIVPTAAQPLGYIEIQLPYTGYKARLWKVVTVDGVETSRTQVNSSNYRAVEKVATVGIATDNPEALAQVQAAIGTGSIDHVQGVVAALNAAAAASSTVILEQE